MYNIYDIKPFVKWAGGKGKLLGQLDTFLPLRLCSEEFTYIEPFVGGGAMLFHMLNKFRNIRKVIFNDINVDLIKAYQTVKDHPDLLIEFLKEMEHEYCSLGGDEARKSYYLEVRARFNQHKDDDIRNSAHLIFLNKTCFNGLYRVNSRGEFNVPIGSYAHPVICHADTILADSAVLNVCDVEIVSGDFTAMENYLNPRMLNFFYFDPPYRPLTQTSSFTAYAKGDFTDNDQKRLAAFCRCISDEGALWMLSNSDCSMKNPNDLFFEKLYQDYAIERVYASRSINANPSKRGKLTELLIHNDYELDNSLFLKAI